jgi:hypothetical protein
MFFVVSLILLLFAFGAIMLIGNTFEEFASDSEFVGYETEFPFIYFIMTNLLTIAIVMGSSILIVLYGKNRLMN